METTLSAAQSQGDSYKKMAQVTIAVGRDRSNTLTWERGMDVLTIYRMSDVEKITLHLALGVEYIVRGIIK